MRNDGVEPVPEGGAEHFGVVEWGRLVRFGELLAEQGELRGLIGPRELDRLWSRHLLNSTAVAEFLSKGIHLADVGAGAGFPGMVLAIVRPDLKVDLIEPMERRTDWLRFVADELKLSNVEVIRARGGSTAGVLGGRRHRPRGSGTEEAHSMDAPVGSVRRQAGRVEGCASRDGDIRSRETTLEVSGAVRAHIRCRGMGNRRGYARG